MLGVFALTRLCTIVHTAIMDGASARGPYGNGTIAQMEPDPGPPPTAASQWWEQAPLEQIDLSLIYVARPTSSMNEEARREEGPRPNAHHSLLSGPTSASVEKFGRRTATGLSACARGGSAPEPLRTNAERPKN